MKKLFYIKEFKLIFKPKNYPKLYYKLQALFNKFNLDTNSNLSEGQQYELFLSNNGFQALSEHYAGGYVYHDDVAAIDIDNKIIWLYKNNERYLKTLAAQAGAFWKKRRDEKDGGTKECLYKKRFQVAKERILNPVSLEEQADKILAQDNSPESKRKPLTQLQQILILQDRTDKKYSFTYPHEINTNFINEKRFSQNHISCLATFEKSDKDSINELFRQNNTHRLYVNQWKILNNNLFFTSNKRDFKCNIHVYDKTITSHIRTVFKKFGNNIKRIIIVKKDGNGKPFFHVYFSLKFNKLFNNNIILETGNKKHKRIKSENGLPDVIRIPRSFLQDENQNEINRIDKILMAKSLSCNLPTIKRDTGSKSLFRDTKNSINSN